MRRRGKKRPVLTYVEGRALFADYGPAPICPRCGLTAVVQRTPRGPRASCCDLWSWGNRPLVDAATHRARQRAHVAFDWLWQFGGMTRSQAYAALGSEMGLRGEKTHISLMDEAACDRVAEVVEVIKRRLACRRWIVPPK